LFWDLDLNINFVFIGLIFPIYNIYHCTFKLPVTFLDKIAGAGGDYYTTYWPQPTFVSDRLYFAHLDYYSYSVLNFR